MRTVGEDVPEGFTGMIGGEVQVGDASLNPTTDLDEVQAQFQEFLRGIRIIPLTTPIAERCAALRQQLKEQGHRVNSRALDLVNAATAMRYQLILVTHNTADYADIAGLERYDWDGLNRPKDRD